MKHGENSHKVILYRTLALSFLSYLVNFIYYIPFYSTLVISAIFQVLIWIKIAKLTHKTEYEKLFGFLSFYKVVLFSIGYIFIESNIFTEINYGLVFTIVLTQYKPFEIGLISMNNIELAQVMSIILLAVFSLIPILTYYLTHRDMENRNAGNNSLS